MPRHLHTAASEEVDERPGRAISPREAQMYFSLQQLLKDGRGRPILSSRVFPTRCGRIPTVLWIEALTTKNGWLAWALTPVGNENVFRD